MEVINRRYYDGFEGEPEIQFICSKGSDSEVLVIWEGYFDQIMELVRPEESGWTGLAYYYHMDLEWNDGPWEIEDLHMALLQFKSIDNQKLRSRAKEILVLLCDILEEAISNNTKVFLVRE